MKRKSHILLLLAGLFLLCGGRAIAAEDSPEDSIPVHRVEYTRLPDMNIPRADHQVTQYGNEVTVIGGHTTGFVRTKTAEYYSFKTGRWTTVPSLYFHDFGFSSRLEDGSLFVGGGAEKDFGVGQTFCTEVYCPLAHSFTPAPIMNRSRCLANSANLGSDRIVIAGNWYREDLIEIFQDGEFTVVKEVAQHRSTPYILPISKDDAIIFSSFGNDDSKENSILEDIVVDRLKYGPFTPEILRQYKPVNNYAPKSDSEIFIGDREKGIYSYLVMVADSSGKKGLMKIDAPKVEGEEPLFSMLEMEGEIPTELFGRKVEMGSHMTVDRNRERCYITTPSFTDRIVVLCIDYGEALRGGRAKLSVLETGQLESADFSIPFLMDNGDLLFTGGIIPDAYNYAPLSTAYILHTSGSEAHYKSAFPFTALVIAILSAIVLALCALLCRRKGKETEEDGYGEDDKDGDDMPLDAYGDKLLAAIYLVMDEKKIFCTKGLTINDVAKELATNSKYISRCINSYTGKTFTDFVNDYRINYAQELLRRKPSMKMTDICEESGFSSDAAFFRNFKARTGKTPAQWLADPEE